MFFSIAKTFWLFLKPTHFLFFLALMGVVLCFTRFARLGRYVALVALTLILLIANFPLGSSSIRNQENAVPTVALSQINPDGILVLGGPVSRKLTESRGGLQVHGSADRILEMIRLMSLFPNAKIVYSGGWGDGAASGLGEADYVKRYLQDLPFNLSRVTFESKSRNTRENIQFSKALVKPQPAESWLLVTSAKHVPRAVNEAKQQGWELVGYPVDYLTTREVPSESTKHSAFANLVSFNHAAYELLGRLAYWITG